MVTTITFKDEGQDFVEWDIDKDGQVIACRPFQARVWCDGFVWNDPIQVGDNITYISPRSSHPIEIQYPVVAVSSTTIETTH